MKLAHYWRSGFLDGRGGWNTKNIYPLFSLRSFFYLIGYNRGGGNKNMLRVLISFKEFGILLFVIFFSFWLLPFVH